MNPLDPRPVAQVASTTRPPLVRERTPPAVATVRLSEVISALSYALDITEGQPQGHAVRSAWIGMRIARDLPLDADQRSSLFFALLLKDLGCSSNAAKVCSLFEADDLAAKRDFKTTDWTSRFRSLGYVLRHARPGRSVWQRAMKVAEIAVKGSGEGRQNVQIRCDRGSEIALLIGFTDDTARAIRCLDEHWDGRGEPCSLVGAEIPLLSRVACLAQTVEVFAREFGVDAAFAMAAQRRGTWFDPALVDAMEGLRDDDAFWRALQGTEAEAELLRYEPVDRTLLADDAQLDRIADAFAKVIDAKSPWTHSHSRNTADIATRIATELGFDAVSRRNVRRAALLHDIGKLGISNLLLDKPGKLTEAELADVRRHPEFTRQILERVTSFREVAELAGNHHECLDGCGYPRGLAGRELAMPDRVIAVADIYEAMSADRPYRKGLAPDEIVRHLERRATHAICPECVAALRRALEV